MEQDKLRKVWEEYHQLQLQTRSYLIECIKVNNFQINNHPSREDLLKEIQDYSARLKSINDKNDSDANLKCAIFREKHGWL